MQIRLQETKVRKQIQITTFATFFLPDFRTFGGSLGRSTVAHFARKVRGGEYCGGQARAENPTKSCPKALVMFATCSWPSLCEQSELQCWRRNRRLCGPAPLQGRVFKIQKNLCAFFCQTTSGEACAHDKRTKREKERPERAASSQPRATPWVSAHKRLRPVRAKVKANHSPILLPLQGVGNGNMVPRALPWALNLLGFQPAQGRRQGFFRIIFTNLMFALSYQKSPYPRNHREKRFSPS